MKLPKSFGGKGFGGALVQAQQAMARAQTIDAELAAERIVIDKGPLKVLFAGNGDLLTLKMDKSIVDPEDVEALEDLIVSALRDGMAQATKLREARVKEIMPNVPGLENFL